MKNARKRCPIEGRPGPAPAVTGCRGSALVRLFRAGRPGGFRSQGSTSARWSADHVEMESHNQRCFRKNISRRSSARPGLIWDAAAPHGRGFVRAQPSPDAPRHATPRRDGCRSPPWNCRDRIGRSRRRQGSGPVGWDGMGSFQGRWPRARPGFRRAIREPSIYRMPPRRRPSARFPEVIDRTFMITRR